MTTLDSETALREVIGEKIPGLEEKVIDYLDDFAVAYIEQSPFVILSTADSDGRCDASPKGDEPGFVQVLDKHTLVIPDRPGNKLAFGHENILKNSNVGILFCIPGTSETLRINGKAELDASAQLLETLAARGKPAVLAIRVTVEECFFHCGKAFIRSKLWQPEAWAAPHKVSFGEMFAARSDMSSDVVAVIDKSIAEDYKNNL